MDKLHAELQRATDSKQIPGLAAAILNTKGDTLFKHVYGLTDITKSPNEAPLTADTPLALFSATKIFTAIVGIRMIEKGVLSLDDLVETYVPKIANIKVVKGWNDDGSPLVEPPKVKPTIRHLLNHTSGLGYDVFETEIFKWRVRQGIPPGNYLGGDLMYFDDGPMIADPGTQFTYSVSTDWLGWVLEKATGMALDKLMDQQVIQPLGLKNTRAHLHEGESTLLTHMRGPDGSITAHPEIALPIAPPFYAGGGYLYSSLNDFTTLLLTIANNGKAPNGYHLLSAEAVEQYLFTDQLPADLDRNRVGRIESTVPPFASSYTFLPDTPKGWSFGFMLALADVPGGRSRGTGSWTGLVNTHYFVDRAGKDSQGRIGIMLTCLLPFLDAEIMRLFGEVEKAAYA